MTKQPIEVITSVERRRRWSREDKERLVAACLEPGAVLSECRLAVNRKNLPQHFQLDSAAPNLIHGS